MYFATKLGTAPASVALSTSREYRAVVGVVVVAAVVGPEISTNVVTRWTAHCRRPVGIALAVV